MITFRNECGEISLHKVFNTSYRFSVSKYYSKQKHVETFDQFLYYLLNPSEELNETSKTYMFPEWGSYKCFLSEYSPLQIREKMFANMGVGSDSKPIPYDIRKLLLEREWEFEEEIKPFHVKDISYERNYQSWYKDITVRLEHLYTVMPNVAFSVTPIHGSNIACAIEDLTKQTVTFRLSVMKPDADISGILTWHASGPVENPLDLLGCT
jgi:hypothetical protein